MAMTQEEYDTYKAQAEKLGLTVNPNVQVQQPVQAPVQAPVQTPQPVPSEAGFMEQFKQDYANIQQTMSDTSPVKPINKAVEASAEYVKEGFENTTVGGLSKQLVEALPDIGEMGGSMAGMYYGAKQVGSVTKNPYGVATGAVVGAMMGSGIGETVKQMFNSEFDPAETIDTMLVSGMFSGAFEGLGRIFELSKTGMQKLRAGKELSVEEIMSMDELVKGLEKSGITLTPAQLTGSNLQMTLEKIGKAGFGGEQQFADLYLAQDNFMADRLEGLVKQLGDPSRKQTGEMFQQAIEDADKQLITWAEPKYAALSKAAKGQPLSLQGTLQSLRNKIAVGDVGRRTGAKSTLDPESEELYQYVLGNVQNTDFKQWFELMKRLNADHRKVLGRIENRNPTLEKAYADVFALLYKDAERSAAKYGTDILKKYKEVTSVVRESKRTLNDSVIKAAVKTSPEYAGEKIFMDGNVSAVESAFKALDEAETIAKRTGNVFDATKAKNDLRAGYLQAIFTKTELADTTAEASVKLLERIVRDPKTKDTFEAMLPLKTQSEVKKVLGWGYQLEKNSAGNFSLIVRGRQSGELNKFANQMTGNEATGFSAIITAKAIATLTAPANLAKRAASGKATNKYLSQLKDLTVKFDKGELTNSDVATLLGLWATNSTDEEEIPVEFKAPNLSNKEALEAQAARARLIANYEKAGMPVPEDMLEP